MAESTTPSAQAPAATPEAKPAPAPAPKPAPAPAPKPAPAPAPKPAPAPVNKAVPSPAAPAAPAPKEQTLQSIRQSQAEPPAKPAAVLPELEPRPSALARLRSGMSDFMGHAGRSTQRLLLRRRRWKKLLALALIIPTIVVFIYLLLFASDIFISETKFAVRGQQATPSFDMMSLLRGGGNNTADSYIVYNYIHSLDMITDLDGKLHLLDHYRDKSHDMWYRLWQKPTIDDLLDYWKWAVETKFDPDTGILTVSVKAFSPEMAQAVCQGILENSEQLVNRMNRRAHEDAMRLAQDEVKRAEQRVLNAQKALQEYREKTVILDPKAVATGLYSVVNRLEGEVTKTTAELSEAMTFMRRDSPKVVTLQNRLEVLKKQLETEKQRLASALADNGKPLSALVTEFQMLTTEETFAQKQLTSAMASLEAARVQAEAKQLYVESFAKPTLPDESLYPRPFLFTLVFFLTLVTLTGLVSLVIAAIREHAGF